MNEQIRLLKSSENIANGWNPFTYESLIQSSDTIIWKKFTAEIPGSGFKQENVEFPSFFSQQAVNIIASKYFYGHIDSGDRENSFKQLIERIALTTTLWGVYQGYFNKKETKEIKDYLDISSEEELKTMYNNPEPFIIHFYDFLKKRYKNFLETSDEVLIFYRNLLYLLVNQFAAFNSPVWFNLGNPYALQQISACFVTSLEDTLESIAENNIAEMMIFRSGSGSGKNSSKLRSTFESLSGGGTPSGPCSFMKINDITANVTKSGGRNRRSAKLEMLNMDHGDIVEFIEQKVKEERKIKILAQNGYSTDFTDPNNAYAQVFFQNSNQSVRATDEFMYAVETNDHWFTLERYPTDIKASAINSLGHLPQGELFEINNQYYIKNPLKDNKLYKVIHRYNARELFDKICSSAWECADPGMMFHDTINRMNTVIDQEEIVACNPCAEYLFLDDTSCNLASLNLLKFFKTGYTEENINKYKLAIKTFIIAMDILIGGAYYPTEKIGKKTRKYRTIGLGPANLGALLMTHGIAYDSEEGRNRASTYMALITLEGYKTSALLAEKFGPFEGCNTEIMSQIIKKHKLNMSGKAFADYAELEHNKTGYRNAQVTVCAPTGTISFIMDCDTTGIESAFALKSYKKLVGGGMIELPVQAVQDGLRALGYSEDKINEYAKGKVQLKDFVIPEHQGVFASAIGEFPLSWEAHIDMTAAIQPYVSGGISKTINMPANATVEDVKNAYMMAWKKGLKGISIYRDGCKSSQPLSDKKEEVANNQIEEKSYSGNGKRRVSPTAPAVRHAFSIGGQEGYIHVGLFDDGTPGEIFITMGKSGSTVNGLIGELSKSYSWNLQYGMPIEKIISKLKNTKFEPAGITDNSDIRFASSIVDYIAKWLELYFVKKIYNIKEPNEIVTPIETKVISTTQHTGEICRICGGLMVKSGTCETCTSCGETTGCG